ncbi:MAG TPA: oxidoreductase [Saprospirales bacterium]|nr:oxidoreductase [Saprospirales bacterium]HAY70927.1 oxidoreductase [Saprospirales bacterium]HRQ29361.1 Gfo/Idh/MocA family oxidoreductase [Saprospiraceae bacterium]
MRKIESNTIKWGVLGVGNVCEVKSVPGMYKATNSEVVAVMRRNPELAMDYAKRHQIKKWYSNAEKLINDPEVNVLYIATPPGSHAELCIKAANAGKPVFVEKPMSRNYDEALEMIDVCKNAGIPLFVAYYRRALPLFLKIKELIEQGRIGEVRFVNIQMYKRLNHPMNVPADDNWRIVHEIAGGGHFYDLASHQFDFLDFLFGKITKVEGFSTNQAKLYEVEDLVSGSFLFENGVVGNGLWCFTTGKVSEKEIVEIVGSNGQIEFKTFGDPTIVLTTDDNGREEIIIPYPQHIQQPLIQTIVDELLGNGTCPSTGESAARTNWVLEQFKRI